MKKIVTIFFTNFFLLFLIVVPVSAHVVVKPNTANVAAFQTFSVGVPNEKDNPTIGLRLVIPAGLNYVSPNVKPGWTIEIKKSGDGESAKVTEIIWSGGNIPVGQRDEFFFSAQVPPSETAVTWKAYQTYENGETISWDQNPASTKDLSNEQKEENEKKGLGPYSETKIINDLSTNKEKSNNSTLPIHVSIIALALSAVSVGLQLRKKK